jgi:uncharacterized protein (DUF362 family)
MNRRKFIQFISAASLYGLLPAGKINSFVKTPQQVYAEHERNAKGSDEKPKVYELEAISKENIEKVFNELGGLNSFIKGELSKATIVIKPNLCLPHPDESGTITSSTSMDLLLDYLTGSGIKKIIITDHTLQNADEFKEIEIQNIIKKYPDVKLVLADDERLYETKEINGKALKKTAILKLLSRADLLINFATAKHHAATHVSLAIKNLMGLIWNRAVFHIGMDLHRAIADLAMEIKPQINIIDAERVLLKGGPQGPGPILEEKKMFVSKDILALDSVVVSRYGFGGKSLSAKEVKHLMAAYENGIGEIDIEKIEVVKI